MTLFVQYFIPCKQLYVFRVKHSPIHPLSWMDRGKSKPSIRTPDDLSRFQQGTPKFHMNKRVEMVRAGATHDKRAAKKGLLADDVPPYIRNQHLQKTTNLFCAGGTIRGYQTERHFDSTCTLLTPQRHHRCNSRSQNHLRIF
jgi:hypothetical protein